MNWFAFENAEWTWLIVYCEFFLFLYQHKSHNKLWDHLHVDWNFIFFSLSQWPYPSQCHFVFFSYFSFHSNFTLHWSLSIPLLLTCFFTSSFFSHYNTLYFFSFISLSNQLLLFLFFFFFLTPTIIFLYFSFRHSLYHFMFFLSFSLNFFPCLFLFFVYWIITLVTIRMEFYYSLV